VDVVDDVSLLLGEAWMSSRSKGDEARSRGDGGSPGELFAAAFALVDAGVAGRGIAEPDDHVLGAVPAHSARLVAASSTEGEECLVREGSGGNARGLLFVLVKLQTTLTGQSDGD